MVADDSFKQARLKNALYGDTYGARRAPDHPEWTGVAGDVAAQVRASFPTTNTRRYFTSDLFNMNRNNFYSTGNLGRWPLTKNQAIVLETTDDITPVPPQYERITYAQESLGMSNSDYFILGVTLLGLFFIVLLTSSR